jgi:phosphoribosylanthranilate isomerase
LRVKICGLTQAEDARMAERAGADFLGFVLTPGFGRSVPPGAAPALVEGTSRPRVAVLVDEAPDVAARLAASIDASVLQLHGSEPRETVEALRGLGDWRIWKAVRAGSVEDVARAVLVYGPLVDALLLEGRRQGIVGGGGVRLEVEPERARELIPDGLEFVLAGGLDPDSVGEAVARFRPNIVDVSSGVEREPGRKDEAALIRFVRAAKEAM